MRTLITGAKGQVGQALADTQPGGVECRWMGHTDLDLADARRMRQVISQFRPDVVINAAAYTAVDKAESEEGMAQVVNAEGPRVIAEAIAGTHCRLLHISTDFVFDGRASLPYRPDAPANPLSAYGRTKLAGERSAMAAAQEQVLVLRTSWVYSAVGKNFLLTMLKLMAERGAVRVVDDQVGTPTSATSLARALWAFATHAELSGLFHWSDAGVASWYDFAVAIGEEAASLGLLRAEPSVAPIATTQYPTPARRPAYSVLDKHSTIQAVGMTPPHWRVSLRAVLKEMSNG